MLTLYDDQMLSEKYLLILDILIYLVLVDSFEMGIFHGHNLLDFSLIHEMLPIQSLRLATSKILLSCSTSSTNLLDSRASMLYEKSGKWQESKKCDTLEHLIPLQQDAYWSLQRTALSSYLDWRVVQKHIFLL